MFATWLRAYREHHGIGLRTLARDLGVAPSTLTRLEHGERQPSLAFLDRFTERRGLRAGVLDGLVLDTETRPPELLAIADRALQRKSQAVLRRAAAKAAREAGQRRQRDWQLLAMVYLAEIRAGPARMAMLQKVFDRAVEERCRLAMAAAAHRMGHIHLADGAMGKAELSFELGLRALSSSGSDGAGLGAVIRARLLRDLGYIRHRQHELGRAAALYREAEALAVAAGDLRVEADCLMGRGLIALDTQQYHEATDLTLRAIEIYRRLRVPDALCGAHINASLCYAALGDAAAQRQQLEQARSWSRYLPRNSPLYGHLANEMGRVLLDLNRPAEAETVIRDGLRHLPEGEVRERALSYRLLARAARQQGEVARALRLFGKAQELLADTPFTEDRLALVIEVAHLYASRDAQKTRSLLESIMKEHWDSEGGSIGWHGHGATWGSL